MKAPKAARKPPPRLDRFGGKPWECGSLETPPVCPSMGSSPTVRQDPASKASKRALRVCEDTDGLLPASYHSEKVGMYGALKCGLRENRDPMF